MENLYNWINNNTELVISIEMNDFCYIDVITIDHLYNYGDSIELTHNHMTITMEIDRIDICTAGMIYTGDNNNRIIIIPVDNDEEVW